MALSALWVVLIAAVLNNKHLLHQTVMTSLRLYSFYFLLSEAKTELGRLPVKAQHKEVMKVQSKEEGRSLRNQRKQWKARMIEPQTGSQLSTSQSKAGTFICLLLAF